MTNDLREALEKIERWFGEFPDTGQFWDRDKKEPMSYAAAYGSNGERDYMRSIARAALATQPAPGGGEAIAKIIEDNVYRKHNGNWDGDHEDLLIAADAILALGVAVSPQDGKVTPRPIDEYHEDMGPVLWWCFALGEWLGEPPYVGGPNDIGFTVEAHTTTRVITQSNQEHDPEPVIHRIHAGGWPGYHTHFTPLEAPALPRADRSGGAS